MSTFLCILLCTCHTLQAKNKCLLYESHGRVRLLTQSLSGVCAVPEIAVLNEEGGFVPPEAYNNDGTSLLISDKSAGRLVIQYTAPDAYYQFTQHQDGRVDFMVQIFSLDVHEFPTFHYHSLAESLRALRVRIMFDEVRAEIGQDFPIHRAGEIAAYLNPRTPTDAEKADMQRLIGRLNDPAWRVRERATRELRKYRFFLNPDNGDFSPEQRNRIRVVVGEFRIDGTEELMFWASCMSPEHETN